MKKVVTVTEVQGEGFEALLGQRVCFVCDNFIWAGDLKGVNATVLLLENVFCVYETGKWDEKVWKWAERVGDMAYLQVSKIEMFYPSLK